MIWTAYLDESGTHDGSPIMLMGGYLGNTEQWAAFDAAWKSLLNSESIEYCHAKHLEHSAKQFTGWSRERREKFRFKASEVKAQHLQLGVTAIIRENDYRLLYKGQPNPSKMREDTKYTVLFRGCLLLVESAVVQCEHPSKDITLNVILEEGAKNAGDAQRFFELAKKEHLPGWEHLLGTMTLGNKELYGLQAADFLVYYANKLERKHHWDQPTDIEKSPYVLPLGASGPPGFKEYRVPITKHVLTKLAADFLKPAEQWANMQDT